MRRHVIAALAVALSLTAGQTQAQETRTHRFFESLGNGTEWLFERGGDAISGLGDATDPSADRHNEIFREEVQQHQDQWNDKLSGIAGIIDRIDDIPGYCRAPSAIELWPAMPDDCLRAMDMHLVDVQNELELLRNEIRAELQMGGGG